MSRRFFSGRSLQAAILSAAAKFELDPDELNYEEIDKRHGLLKSRGKVVIAVDPALPRKGGDEAVAAEEPPEKPPEKPAKERPAPSRRRSAAAEKAPEPEQAEEEIEAAAPEPEPEPEPEADAEEKPAKRPASRRRSRTAAAAKDDEEAEPEEEVAASAEEEPEEAEQKPARSRRRSRSRRGAREAAADREEPKERDDSGREDRGEAPAAEGREGLVELPDRPRALADRYPRASGPIAKAAVQAIEAIAAVAGLELEAQVFEGDDRLEIDLSGGHHGLLIAEDGELLVAIEHLLPRAMRGFGGETAAVRVDCENYQEIREERLRSYAQVVAGEVRRTGRTRNLDPLSPSDRRIVHLTVADEPGVESESEGSGYLKRVRVSPA